jgi:anti-anti-sigma factor
MPLKYQRKETDGRVIGDAAPCGHRGVLSRSSRAPLKLVPSTVSRGYLTGHADAGVNLWLEEQLVIRFERRDGTAILWLSGALERATACLLDRELNARTIRLRRVIVDPSGLEFIDSAGLESLARIHRRARKRGDRLSFRHGPHVVERPFDLPRAVQLRSRSALHLAGVGVGDEDFYFALAMACADVDHPRPGDRPGAA